MNRHGAVWLVALAALGLSGLGAQCESRRDQPLTIVLVEYRGAEAVESGERLAKELASKGLRDVFVVNGPEVTSVCVGHISSWKDPAADRLKAQVRRIRDAAGQLPFANVMLMPVPEAAPKNEWPLEGAKGIYTLHVATWGLETASREASAQTYGRDLRAKGFEAYVYHGPRFSMVTVGAFGPGVFDDPTKISRPGVKPEIVDPKVLALMKKFPGMKLDGQDTVVPTSLVKIPGREPPAAVVPTTRAMYRIVLRMVDTRTGLPVPRGEGTGVAQSKDEVAAAVRGLAQQLLGSLPKEKPARIGVVGVLATGAQAAGEQADRQVAEVLAAVLKQAAREGRRELLTISAPDATAQVLDAAGLKAADVLRDPRKARGVPGLDLLVTGTVTVIPAR